MEAPAHAAQGWLALVATPIGNLEDLTLRALRVLREADLIAAEDTRRTLRLCQHFEIRAPVVAYHAFNEHRRTAELLDKVAAGQRVAVLSDAGTPALSDPGFLLVRAALAVGLEPRVVPGVSSLTFAVVAAGLPVDRFVFAGFPPVKPGRRQRFLTELAGLKMTVFLFEGPHRIGRLLREIASVSGPLTRVAVIREATKLHEECVRGAVAEVQASRGDADWRGECVVAVDWREGPVAAEEESDTGGKGEL